MTHAFDEAIALSAQEDGSFLGRTSPAYANMVGPYGGMTAAQALQSVMLHPQRLGEPVSLTVNFAAALADGAFTVIARPARTNRSTQHWMIEVQQQGDAVLTGTAVTALRRQTWNGTERPMPTAARPADVPLPAPRKSSEWINRYEMRLVGGGFPTVWDGADHSTGPSQLWTRDNPPRPLDFPSLTALSDVFFPRIWLRRAKFVPIGTMSMTVYFHADSALLAATGDGYLFGQSQAQGFTNGYFDQSSLLWNEAGQLLATTHQVVYYKE
jgi:acyl-CoA thioesterase